MRAFAITVLCVLLAIHGGTTRADVSATVDRNRLAESESFDLLIRSDSLLNASDPDLSPLEQDFEVLGSAQSSNISILNGSRTAYTEWRVSLLPKRSGTLRIPEIRVGSARTRAIDIVVTSDGGAPGTSGGRSRNDDVMLEVETDKDTVHVQQQLLYTVRILHAVNFNRGASLDEPELPNAVVRKLGERSYEKIIGNRRFGVFERRYAVFPQASGELQLPALRFEAQVGSGGGWFDPFGTRGRTVRLRTESRTIKVFPPEAGSPIWLPARVLTLVETWDKSPHELHVGESATRTLTITASGLTGAQLPPLPLPGVKGLRFYPDQPKIQDAPSDTGVNGSRAESTAVIPTEAGDIDFPEVRVRWWDTEKQRFDDAIVPAKTVHVLPAASAAAPAPLMPPRTAPSSIPEPARAPGPALTQLPMPSRSNQPWLWIASSILLAFTTLISSWQWWRLTRRQRAAAGSEPTTDQNEKDLFGELRRACQRNDAAGAETLLLRWARAAFPDVRLHNLSQLTDFADDAEFNRELHALQHRRYARSTVTATDWNGAALLARLEALRKRAKAKTTVDPSAALPPLYT